MQNFRASALYDYEPANDDEVELREGDMVLVTMCRDDGWFQGTNLETDEAGLFPGNYVEKIDGTDANQSNYYTDTNREEPLPEDEMPPDIRQRPMEDARPARSAQTVPITNEKKVSEPAPAPAPAPAKKKAKGGGRKKSTLKCAYWAQNVGLFSGACAIMLGAMNFVWWSGDFAVLRGETWPIQNRKITNPYMSQMVFGANITGHFPGIDNRLKPKPGPDTITNDNGKLVYVYTNINREPVDIEEFRKRIQTGNPTANSPTIQQMSGHYDKGKDFSGGILRYVGALLGPYTMVIGVISLVVECCCTVKRPKDGCQHKSKYSCVGIAYVFASLPMFMAVPTCLVGLMYVLSSIPHCYATKNKEYGEDRICCGSRQGATRHWTESSLFNKEKSFKQRCSDLTDSIARGNKTGQVIVCCIWIFLHILIATQRLVEMIITYRCSMFMRGNEMWDIENPDFINECCQKPGAWDRLISDPVETPGKYDGPEFTKSCGPDILDPYGLNFRGLTDKQSKAPKPCRSVVVGRGC